MTALTCAAALWLTACAGTPKVELVDSQKDTAGMQGPARSVLVMALYPEEDQETRVTIENAIVGSFREAKMEAHAGFRLLESYADLEHREPEVKALMQEHGLDAIVVIDPIRIKDFDPAAYDARRAAYRAWGLTSSASINLIGKLSAEASAAKAEIDVLVWDLGTERFVWHSEYDLNAPGSYELEVAREYAVEFGKMVADSLRSEGLVQ